MDCKSKLNCEKSDNWINVWIGKLRYMMWQVQDKVTVKSKSSKIILLMIKKYMQVWSSFVRLIILNTMKEKSSQSDKKRRSYGKNKLKKQKNKKYCWPLILRHVSQYYSFQLDFFQFKGGHQLKKNEFFFSVFSIQLWLF